MHHVQHSTNGSVWSSIKYIHTKQKSNPQFFVWTCLDHTFGRGLPSPSQALRVHLRPATRGSGLASVEGRQAADLAGAARLQGRSHAAGGVVKTSRAEGVKGIEGY